MGSEPRWLTVREAAAALGITESAVRKRVEKGTLESRPGNDGRARVLVAERSATAPGTLPETSAPGAGEVAELRERVAEFREQVARLEERLAAEEAIKAALRQRVEQLHADRDRERAEMKAALERERALAEAERERVDRLLAALADRRERRPWPGLRAWWRRFVEGER